MRIEPVHPSERLGDSHEHPKPPKKDTTETSDFQSILDIEICKITQPMMTE